jgi:hypothetical protein
MVSTPKVGSKRWKKSIAAAARKSGGGDRGRRVSNKGVKRKSATDSAAEADINSPQVSSKKPRLPAGNSLQKSSTELGHLFRNEHNVSWAGSGLSSLPSVELLPTVADKTVIEIVDSDEEKENEEEGEKQSEMEEGEIGSTLLEVGQEMMDLVAPGVCVCVYHRVVDPDLDWIRIQRLCGSVLGIWIRIQGQ